MASRVAAALSALLVAAGLAVLVWANASDWIAQAEADRAIRHVSAQWEGDPDAKAAALAAARSYNRALAKGDVDGELPYMRQLGKGDGGAMDCRLEIPAIGVRQPVYHGATDEVLMAGIGHWEGSSLPVGGESSHCVLLGHSGMRNARMLDNATQLKEGDVALLYTLGTAHAYEVYATEVVWPEDVEAALGIVEGRDLLTLVTCTPYGVNTHRLLVHMKRCAHEPADEGELPLAAVPADGRTAALGVGAAIAAAAAGSGVLAARKRRGGVPRTVKAGRHGRTAQRKGRQS